MKNGCTINIRKDLDYWIYKVFFQQRNQFENHPILITVSQIKAYSISLQILLVFNFKT